MRFLKVNHYIIKLCRTDKLSLDDDLKLRERTEVEDHFHSFKMIINSDTVPVRIKLALWFCTVNNPLFIKSWTKNNKYIHLSFNFLLYLDTGYFRKVYRSLQVRVPHNILKYLTIQKLPQKRSRQSIYLSNSQQKIFILWFNFIKDLIICIYIP